MSNPEMKGARILRFHTSDKVFHSINAICWYALVITGAIVYFGHWMGDISDETSNLMMVWHLWLGALFTLNFVGYVLFAPERFAVTLKNLLEWDKNTIMWFRNFGGYPRRFFKIPFGPVEVPPQGRYNGGQKMSYLIFLAAVVYLIATGWLLWLGAPLLGKTVFYWLTFGAASLLPLWLHALIFLWLSCPWNISRAFGESVPATSLTKPLNITLRHGSNVTSSKLLKNNP